MRRDKLVEVLAASVIWRLATDLATPILLVPARVWRCYRGGLLLERLLGCAAPVDGRCPEAWLGSTTPARNGPHQQSPDEGISRVRLPDGRPGPLLTEVLPEQSSPGVLCKLLDSAVRLPIQCHPDRAFARAHLNSEHGKTELWIVLGTRPMMGTEPRVYLGFRPDADRESFARAVQDQDIDSMLGMLHSHRVEEGQAWLVPGRMPHAIGPGLMLLEVQEPTDWVVQPERNIGEFELSDTEMWGPLTPEIGLDCFDFEGRAPVEPVVERVRLAWERAIDLPGGSVDRLVGTWNDKCFLVKRFVVRDALDLPPSPRWRIGLVVAGRGTLQVGKGYWPLRPADSMLLTDRVPSAVLQATGPDPLDVFLAAAG